MNSANQNALHCPTCGQKVQPNAQYCMQCGGAIPSATSPSFWQPVAGSAVSPETSGAANIALVIEVIPGVFGLLGLGHVFSGRVKVGLGVMFGWFLYIIVGSALTSLTLGGAACLTIPILIVIPIVSGYIARTHILKTGATGNWKGVMAIGCGGAALIILAVIAVFLLVLTSGRY